MELRLRENISAVVVHMRSSLADVDSSCVPALPFQYHLPQSKFCF